jgi:arsenate reductase
MITIYGIPNCDKCRAALKWFENSGAEYSFHDVRTDGLNARTIELWQAAVGDDALINKRSQTWRKIPETQREGLDSTGNRQLMLEHPTLIKRPIVTRNALVSVGYDEAAWTHTFLTGHS